MNKKSITIILLLICFAVLFAQNTRKNISLKNNVRTNNNKASSLGKDTLLVANRDSVKIQKGTVESRDSLLITLRQLEKKHALGNLFLIISASLLFLILLVQVWAVFFRKQKKQTGQNKNDTFKREASPPQKTQSQKPKAPAPTRKPFRWEE